MSFFLFINILRKKPEYRTNLGILATDLHKFSLIYFLG